MISRTGKPKDTRNSVNNTLKDCEKNYVSNEVNAHKDNVASLWKIASRIIPYKERRTHVSSKSTEQIVNDFNEHFVSVGKVAANAAVQLAKDNHIDIPAARDPPIFIGNSFNIYPVSCTEINDIINTSLTTSTFPDYWKEAEVIPLLKEGDHE